MFAGQAFAQSTVTITGTVLDELSEPIIGGSVQVKDSKTAAATNIDGQYTIQAPANGTLVFTYLGCKPMEVPVASAKTANQMCSSNTASSELDELVVVGYGVMKNQTLPVLSRRQKAPTSSSSRASTPSKASRAKLPV